MENSQVHIELIDIKQKLDAHLLYFEQHERDESVERAKNSAKIDMLITNTADLVSAWNAAEGAIKFGNTVGKFVKWLSGFAVLGYVVNWFGGLK